MFWIIGNLQRKARYPCFGIDRMINVINNVVNAGNRNQISLIIDRANSMQKYILRALRGPNLKKIR